jgi:predicted nucleotidyltransferase
LQTKLAKINTENKQVLQLKTNAYNKLLSYFGVRLPYFSVNIFGSLASGVSLPCSDIDLLLTPQVTLYID